MTRRWFGGKARHDNPKKQLANWDLGLSGLYLFVDETVVSSRGLHDPPRFGILNILCGESPEAVTYSAL